MRRPSAAIGVICFAWVLFATPLDVVAQGMRSAPSSTNPADFDLGKLNGVNERQIATLQRLLQRLNFLKADEMSRQLDIQTRGAVNQFLSSADPNAKLSNYDDLLHLLYTSIWRSEGWGTGQAAGQDTVVDSDKVKAAQQTLRKLGYEIGPVDGKFGPATLSAVEVFQQDVGMKVDGLLNRNTHDAILRALVLNGEKPNGEVRILNWPDYIDPTVLERFTKESKIQVVHDIFENSDETKELLLSGSSNYDVIVQSSSQLRPILDRNAVLQLDRAKLPNYGNLDPAALQYTAELDPQNSHSIPYMWGTVGIGVNVNAIRKIMPDAKVNSLAMFLDPAFAKPLSACGLAFVDEPTDVVPAIVAYIGGDISKIGIADLEAVEHVLSETAPYVKVVSAARYIDDLAEGKYCAVVGYSGDMFMARDAAETAGRAKISYYVPAEGSLLWFDLMVIPKNAPHVDAAYRFLNYLLEPEIAAANTNYLQYANPNKASAPYIDASLLDDPGLYPPVDVLARLRVLQPLTANVEAELIRIWEKLPKANP
jgi:putrescine transport system substrate-binding protein